jgi:UDP-N-acetylglucosamine 4-epimerase
VAEGKERKNAACAAALCHIFQMSITRYQELQATIRSQPRRWLVTGGSGFIGSHVVQQLLQLEQRVTVLDDLSTGHRRNLDAASTAADDGGTKRMAHFLKGDVRDEATCRHVMDSVERVVHLAAMGSVPLSMEKPEECHAANVTGTLNIFLAARAAGVKQCVYASSSAVYGDDPLETKREDSIGKTLSPYAASKRMDEIYSQTLCTAYGQRLVGLRFFNVFGPRQDPKGAYAAVIPQWIAAMKSGEKVFINGDGETTRDFCYVSDVVQALLTAAMTENDAAMGDVFNVGLGKATSLNELFKTLQSLVREETGKDVPDVIYRDFRAGDIRHSCADVSKVRDVLGFAPEHTVMDGLRQTVRAF